MPLSGGCSKRTVTVPPDPAPEPAAPDEPDEALPVVEDAPVAAELPPLEPPQPTRTPVRVRIARHWPRFAQLLSVCISIASPLYTTSSAPPEVRTDRRHAGCRLRAMSWRRCVAGNPAISRPCRT